MKKIGLISDVHGNLHALLAVLAYLEKEQVDEIWCLGDIVGYGAFPSECIEKVRENCSIILGGNHDLAVAGKISFREFSFDAAVAGEWTVKRLNDSEKEFLASLEPELLVKLDGRSVLLTHGNPANPIWDYVFGRFDVQRAAYAMEEKGVKVNFLGHSHVPSIGYVRNSEVELEVCRPGETLTIFSQEYDAVLFNPGSVGQPRDFDWRASGAVIDEDGLVKLFRVEYDVNAAAEAIIEADLPVFLAQRLKSGS